MHSAICLSILRAVVVLVLAHAAAGSPGYGLPRIMGGGKFKEAFQNREAFGNAQPRDFKVGPVEERSPLIPGSRTIGPRQQSCGPGVGSCAAGLCCSSDGVCGTGIDYCEGPDCQFDYGPACDANTVPPGASTSSIARPQLGSVPYGVRINDCTKAGAIALTYDDGPYLYTSDLLNLLDKYNAKVTFFITGNNLGKGQIDGCSTGYPAIIQRMIASGHQVASHTWSHQHLPGLSQSDFNHQIYYNEMAFRNVLGYFPTYFRPPYVDCDTQCFSRLKTVGYHVIYYDLDTFDYLNDDPNLIQYSKNNFSNYLVSTAPNPSVDNVLSLSHDTHYQTVYNLTEFMLQTIASYGYSTSVTVGECLNDPPANWYRSAGTPTSCSTSTTTSSPLAISTDATCGPGRTCLGSTFGNCCSKYGWCGTNSSYCGLGCQPAYGTCGLASSTTTPSSSVAGTKPSTSSSIAGTTPSSSIAGTTPSSSIAGTTPSSSVATTTPSSSVAGTKTSSLVASTTTAVVISTDGTCGTGKTCLGSTYGNCCSRYGFCGSTSNYCGPFCQPAYGTCSPTPSSTATALVVSTEGSCGGGITCQGSTFGNCCSAYGFCGNTTAYCALPGCQASFGTCS